MPNLLVAPGRQEELRSSSSGNSGNEGWYSDGAYTGLPSEAHGYDAGVDGLEDGEEEDEDVDAQEAYYNALLARFAGFREALARPPPPGSHPPEMHGSRIEMSKAVDPRAKQPKWSHVLRHVPPTTQFLASLSQEDVVRGLKRVESLLTRKNLVGSVEGGNLAVWSWGLLGRCRDVGQMGSEDVSTLRDLGKTALWVGRKMRGQALRARAEDNDAVEEELGDDSEGQADDLAVEVAHNGDGEGGNHGGTADRENEEHGMVANQNGGMDLDSSLKDDFEPADRETAGTDDTELELAKSKALEGMKTGQSMVEDKSTNPSSSKNHGTGGSSQDKSDGNIKELEQRAFATLDIIVTIVGER